MKAVKINLYQPSAQFRVPMFNGCTRATFVLPPYSTAIGMVHCLCKWNVTHEIKISISCTNERLSDPQTNMTLGWAGGAHAGTVSDEFQLRFPVIVEDGHGGYFGWTRRVIENDWSVVDRNYIIHISSENEQELQEIYKAFLYPPVFRPLDDGKILFVSIM